MKWSPNDIPSSLFSSSLGTFQQLSPRLKCSSLWSALLYSMLSSILHLHSECEGRRQQRNVYFLDRSSYQQDKNNARFLSSSSLIPCSSGYVECSRKEDEGRIGIGGKDG